MENRRDLLKSLASLALLSCLPKPLRAENLLRTSNNLPASRQIKRVLSAGRVADVILLSLAAEKLVGISMEQLPSPVKRYFPEQIRQIPRVGRLVGRGSTAPLEKIVAMRPDIIVDVGSTSKIYLDTAEKISRQTQIPYVVIDGRFEQTAEQIRQLAALIDERQRGEQLAGLAQIIMEKTHKTLQHDTALSVYSGRGADGLETGLSGSIHTEVLDWLGAKNAAESVGEKMIARVSAEQILLWNPQVIITHDVNFYATLRQPHPIWSKVAAVRNKRVFLIPTAPFGWLDQPPGVNRLLGCLWLAHKLAPQKFPATETAVLIRRYFQLFYQYELSDQELADFGIA
ncbi:ABC transporter substrate-binding protein [Pasteurellaceae bacterium LIM206]|nr:ABC transporter substrate-binding protein [Pasteurellaceae bacterium LIM206]